MRTIDDLRETLFDVVSDIRNKKISTSEANAIVQVANSIVAATKTELRYREITNTYSRFIEIDEVGGKKKPLASVTTHRLYG